MSVATITPSGCKREQGEWERKKVPSKLVWQSHEFQGPSYNFVWTKGGAKPPVTSKSIICDLLSHTKVSDINKIDKVRAHAIAACSSGAHLLSHWPLSLWWKLILSAGTRATVTSDFPQFIFPRFPQVPIYLPTRLEGWTAGWVVHRLPLSGIIVRHVNHCTTKVLVSDQKKNVCLHVSWYWFWYFYSTRQSANSWFLFFMSH